jgi:hypothetical protein
VVLLCVECGVPSSRDAQSGTSGRKIALPRRQPLCPNAVARLGAHALLLGICMTVWMASDSGKAWARKIPPPSAKYSRSATLPRDLTSLRGQGVEDEGVKDIHIGDEERPVEQDSVKTSVGFDEVDGGSRADADDKFLPSNVDHRAPFSLLLISHISPHPSIPPSLYPPFFSLSILSLSLLSSLSPSLPHSSSLSSSFLPQTIHPLKTTDRIRVFLSSCNPVYTNRRNAIRAAKSHGWGTLHQGFCFAVSIATPPTRSSGAPRVYHLDAGNESSIVWDDAARGMHADSHGEQQPVLYCICDIGFHGGSLSPVGDGDGGGGGGGGGCYDRLPYMTS